MATQKLAYRRLVRNQPDNQLHVEFVDAQTGQVITDLAGYTLVDQGNDLPKTTTTADELPVDPHKGRTGSDRRDEGHTDWGATASQDYSRGSNSGKSLIDGLTNTFNTAKKGIGAIQDAKDKGKMDIATWITQVTNGAIIPDNIKKTDVNQDGVKVGTAYNVPPADNKVTPSGDSTKLDQVMGADSNTPNNIPGTTPVKLPTGQVARNIVMSNQDAVRSQAVKSTVLTDLAAVVNATDPTVTVKVNSGGQEPINSLNAVTGLNRLPKTVNHDVDVNGSSFASDQQYYKNGKQITPVSDPAFFKELAKNAAIAGFTQIGMGGNTVHLGKDPKDTHVRTWVYNGWDKTGLDKAVQTGIKLRQDNPELYTQMVAAVAANDPNAPRPASRASQQVLGGQDNNSIINPGGPGNVSVPHPAVVAANEARKSLGLTPILDATQEALAGVSASIPRYDINAGAGGGLGTAIDMYNQNSEIINNAIRPDDYGNWFDQQATKGARGLVFPKFQEAFGGMVGAAKQIIPAVASNMAGGFVDSVNSGITSAREALGGFLAPKEQSTTVNPTPNSLQTMTGLPHIDVAKAQAEEAKQTLQQAKVQEQINKKLALSDAGFMGKAATGKPVSDPISDAYSLKNAERRDMLIRTVLGEAEGEGTVGQLAVINTIKNRALATGTDPLDIVKAPEQYDGIKRASKFSPNDPLYKQVGVLLDEAWKGQLPDNTGGAKHFHANWDNPGWGANMVQSGTKPVKIGNQTFYPEQGKNPMGMEGLSTGFLGPQARRGPEIQTLNNGQAFIGKASNKPATQNTNSLSEMAGTGFMPRSSSSSRTSLSDMTGLGTRNPAKIPAGVNTSSGGYITKNQSDAIRSTGGGSSSGGNPYTPAWQSSPASSGSKGVGSISGGVARNPTTTVPRATTPTPTKNLGSGSSSVGSGTKTTTTTKNSSGSKANSLDGN